MVEPTRSSDVVDLLVVGAGPGGLACSLRAKERGIAHVVIEQEERIGGTVAAYPRRKLVMTQPMSLPLHGRLKQLSYQKEELVELWTALARDHALPVRTGVKLTALTRGADGLFEAATSAGPIRARHVCLALGRRGSPRKLGVPGEQLPKVSYSLLDAESYQHRRILVVGGGDSAIEAALGLAEQPGNTVTLSYRKKAFFRLKARNENRLKKALEQRRLEVLFETQVTRIEPEAVHLVRQSEDAPDSGVGSLTGVGEARAGPAPHHNPTAEAISVPNDEVFVFAGGDPPFAMLEKAGVSFDPKARPPEPATVADNSLMSAIVLVLVSSGGMLAWASLHRTYYELAPAARPTSELHRLLRPAGPVGLGTGLLAAGLFIWNLAYLLRRSPRFGRWVPWSLRSWMNSHVFTGLLAFLLVLVHAGFSLRDNIGGHALIAFAIVVATGVIGRYLYAFVPRAANGAEVDLESLQGDLATLSGQWDRSGRGFGQEVRLHVDEMLHAGRWRPGLASRLWALAAGQLRLRSILANLRRQGRHEGIPEDEVRRVSALARKAYRLTVLVTHYEEVRAVLSSWRYFHRWLALLLILLTAIHIALAVRFAQFDLTFRPTVAGGHP